MMKKLYFILSCLGLFLVFASGALAQTSRKTVSGAEVTGTFRDYFTGKFKGNSSEIKILALGKGKLKVSFDLVYPFIDGTGGMMANVGQAEGIAEISGDTAIFTSSELDGCKITIKFIKPGSIKVTQNGVDSECGFGFNVSATGTYRKVSSAKPKFEAP